MNLVCWLLRPWWSGNENDQLWTMRTVNQLWLGSLSHKVSTSSFTFVHQHYIVWETLTYQHKHQHPTKAIKFKISPFFTKTLTSAFSTEVRAGVLVMKRLRHDLGLDLSPNVFFVHISRQSDLTKKEARRVEYNICHFVGVKKCLCTFFVSKSWKGNYWLLIIPFLIKIMIWLFCGMTDCIWRSGNNHSTPINDLRFLQRRETPHCNKWSCWW